MHYFLLFVIYVLGSNRECGDWFIFYLINVNKKGRDKWKGFVMVTKICEFPFWDPICLIWWNSLMTWMRSWITRFIIFFFCGFIFLVCTGFLTPWQDMWLSLMPRSFLRRADDAEVIALKYNWYKADAKWFQLVIWYKVGGNWFFLVMWY